MAYDQRVTDLADKLRPLCAGIKVKELYWIEGPHQTLEEDWCSECAYFKWRNLRRHDRKNSEEYYRSGGYRTENDNFAFCAGCGCRLNVSPTSYCCEEAVAHFEEHGAFTHDAETAYEIVEVLDALDWICDKDDPHDLRERAVAVAEKLLPNPT